MLRDNNDHNEVLDDSLISMSSSNISENVNFDNVCQRFNTVSFLITNARSLPPKIRSLITYFEELELHFALVTETWMSEGDRYDRNAKKLEDRDNLEIIRKSRKTRGGGVAIVFDKKKIKLKYVKIKRNSFEVVAAVGRTTDDNRKLLIISAYYPPQMKKTKVEELNRCISDFIDDCKVKYDSLAVIIGGDMNQKDISAIIVDHPDVMVLDTPATRREEKLDLCLTNLKREDCYIRKFAPLTNDDGVKSDHDCLAVTIKSAKTHHFKKKKISFRPYTVEAETMFGARLAAVDWADLHLLSTDQAVKAMDETLDAIYSESFQLKTRVIKSTDKDWMTSRVKRLTEKRRKCFRKQGKCDRWDRIDAHTTAAIRDAKADFLSKSKKKVLEAKNTGSLFKAINSLKSKDPSKGWNIRSLFPALTERQIADNCAHYFSSISKEYPPVGKPERMTSPAWELALHEVSLKLKHCKKPKSTVKGDLVPALVTKFHDLLAVPLLCIYNKVLAGGGWPSQWKEETVKIIPKSAIPEDIKDLRNISCTPLFSKVLEAFVLKKLRETVKLSRSQFGGIPGTSIDHFLCETWHEILTNLEDPEAATSLLSIDFSKAFNRMDHSVCLEALDEMGVSPDVVKVVQSFLHARKMAVHIGDAVSVLECVPGGAPQGSVLGSFLFCVATDRLSRVASGNITPNF